MSSAVSLWQDGRSVDACNLLAEAEQIHGLEATSQAWLKAERAYFLGLQARFAESKALFDEAEGLLRECGALIWLGDLEWRRGLVLHFFGDFRASDRCFRAALASGEAANNRWVIAFASAGVGKNLMMSGNPHDALAWFERALAIFQKEGSNLHVSAIFSELAVCYFALDKLDKSLELLLQAEEIDRETKSRSGLQIVLANIGNIYLQWGEYFKAIFHYQQALEIAQEAEDRISTCKWLNNLAIAYGALGNETLSMQFRERAGPIQREIEEERNRVAEAGWSTNGATSR